MKPTEQSLVNSSEMYAGSLNPAGQRTKKVSFESTVRQMCAEDRLISSLRMGLLVLANASTSGGVTCSATLEIQRFSMCYFGVSNDFVHLSSYVWRKSTGPY